MEDLKDVCGLLELRSCFLDLGHPFCWKTIREHSDVATVKYDSKKHKRSDDQMGRKQVSSLVRPNTLCGNKTE